MNFIAQLDAEVPGNFILVKPQRSTRATSLLIIVFFLLGVDQTFGVNGPPTIGAISNQIVYVDQPAPIQLDASDVETPTNNLQLSFATSNPSLIPPENAVFHFFDFDGHLYITLAPAFGQIGIATNTVTVSDGTNSVNTSFVLTVNPPPPGAARFVNTDVIAIPTNGPATPYPSTINVTGMSGTITDMTLTVSKFAHEYPDDVHMLLVGPTGQGVVIMSHVGGGNQVTNVTFTLTDASPAGLPNHFELWSEQFKPADFATNDFFPAPAPPPTNGHYGPVALSTFNGLSANGAWSLYVYDDIAPSQGVIAGGWSLMIATTGGGSSPPEIGNIPDQSTPVNVPTPAIPFTINDVDTPISSLTLSGASSDPTLVPTNNIVFGGAGANRTVTVSPAAGQNDTVTITVTVSDGTNTASDMFVLLVSTPPTITGIADQVIDEDTPTAALSFTVGDAETPAGSLTVSRFSSNPTLVPTNNVVFGGSGANRTVTVNPATNQFGTATITMTVSDGLLSTNTSFLLTVNPVNDPPTISVITDQTTLMGRSVGPFPFTVGDADNNAGSLTLSGTSSNTNLVPDASIVFFNLGGVNRGLTVTPAGQTGTATITVIVSDGAASTSNSFLLTVSPPGPGTAILDNLSIITIPDSGTATLYPSTITVTGIIGTITQLTVTLKDLGHTYPDDLNILLVGPSGQKVVIFSDVGGGNVISNVTVTLSDAADYPLPNEARILAGTYKPTDYGNVDPFPSPAPSGPYATTLSVFNGQSPNGTWSLYVYDEIAPDHGMISNGWSLAIATESPPTIGDIPDQATTLDTATAAIPFTIGDLETAASNLVLTAGSSNPTLVPTNNIVFGGSASNRTVTVRPASNQVGAATLTLIVSDRVMAASNSFVLTVGPAPLTVTGITASNKVYDGGTVATLDVTGATLAGVHGSADVTLSTGAATGTFDSKHIGTGKTVTVAGLTITGADTNKYTLTQPTTSANITARAITVTAATDSKGYDGTTASAGVPTVTGGSLTNGETGNFTQTFTDKNVGTSKTLTPAGAVNDGFGGANYNVTFANNTTGVITPATLTVTAENKRRPYGVANPVLTAGYSGFVNDETLPTSGVTGSPQLSTTATNTSPAGDYPITAAVGSLNATNYAFSFVSGALTVFGGPPVILSLTGAGTDTVVIQWSAISNVTYRVQYKVDLNDTNWSDLFPDVTATGDTASATNNPGDAAQRVYRIKVVP
jgi:subtilisin-like proprotein convertase family protein